VRETRNRKSVLPARDKPDTPRFQGLRAPFKDGHATRVVVESDPRPQPQQLSATLQVVRLLHDSRIRSVSVNSNSRRHWTLTCDVGTGGRLESNPRSQLGNPSSAVSRAAMSGRVQVIPIAPFRCYSLLRTGWLSLWHESAKSASGTVWHRSGPQPSRLRTYSALSTGIRRPGHKNKSWY
jgi:hypothetical protein